MIWKIVRYNLGLLRYGCTYTITYNIVNIQINLVRWYGRGTLSDSNDEMTKWSELKVGI